MLVEIFADTSCPWCFIGKRRFERALEMRSLANVDVIYLPYQLYPQLPSEGVQRKILMRKKFGEDERVRRLEKRLSGIGREEQIEFNFDSISIVPNTVNSHTLIEFGKINKPTTDLLGLIFSAYFSEGRDIGDITTLIDLGTSAGLDRDELTKFMNSESAQKTIAGHEDYSRRIGVKSVPWFVIDQKYAISGAQAPEVFLQIFDLVQQDNLGS